MSVGVKVRVKPGTILGAQREQVKGKLAAEEMELNETHSLLPAQGGSEPDVRSLVSHTAHGRTPGNSAGLRR